MGILRWKLLICFGLGFWFGLIFWFWMLLKKKKKDLKNLLPSISQENSQKDQNFPQAPVLNNSVSGIMQV